MARRVVLWQQKSDGFIVVAHAWVGLSGVVASSSDFVRFAAQHGGGKVAEIHRNAWITVHIDRPKMMPRNGDLRASIGYTLRGCDCRDHWQHVGGFRFVVLKAIGLSTDGHRPAMVSTDAGRG